MLQLNESLLEIQEKSKGDVIDFDSGNLTIFITKYADILFVELTKILNIIFSHGNKDFEPFTLEFVNDNFSIALIVEVVDVVVKQNKMEGVLPFFQRSFLEEFGKRIKNIAKKATDQKKN